MKIRSFFSVIILVVFIVCTSDLSAAQQSKDRLIKKLPVEQKEPLVITGIKVNGQSVSFEKTFVADDNWLRGLVISVKNTSDKRILFTSVRLVFPRDAHSKDQVSIYDLSYGNDQLMMREPSPSERLLGIMPDGTTDLRLTVQDFVDLQKFLVGTGYSSDIERVNLRIGHVIFEDDTMWYTGAVLRRDSNDSAKWVNVNLPRTE